MDDLKTPHEVKQKPNVSYRNPHTGKPSKRKNLISQAWDYEQTITLEEYRRNRSSIRANSFSPTAGVS